MMQEGLWCYPADKPIDFYATSRGRSRFGVFPSHGSEIQPRRCGVDAPAATMLGSQCLDHAAANRIHSLLAVVPVSHSLSVVPPTDPAAHRRALDFLFGRIDYERRSGSNHYGFRLRRTRELFQELGLGQYLYDPDNRQDRSSVSSDSQSSDSQHVPLIHIAGTKGKGSTALMVSRILSAAGYRVGMYTSPHLTHLEERFRVNETPCSGDALIELVEFARPIVDRLVQSNRPVSFFELSTALAVLHFHRCQCDAIILEVGLGGRLDSTNVCDSTVTAITSIGLDHQHVLGDTIEQIAGEKAGILKPSVPVVSGVVGGAAEPVIRHHASLIGCELIQRGRDFRLENVKELSVGVQFDYVNREGNSDSSEQTSAMEMLYLPIDGVHQAENAAVAISIAKTLTTRGSSLRIDQQAIRSGLSGVQCAGRLERFLIAGGCPTETVQVIVDSAHNPDSIKAMCDAIEFRKSADATANPQTKATFAGRSIDAPVAVVFGTSLDKDALSMVQQLKRIADRLIFTRYTTNPRAFCPHTLAETISVEHSEPSEAAVTVCDDPWEAFELAREWVSGPGTVIVCGSFFLAGEIRPRVLALPGIQRLGSVIESVPRSRIADQLASNATATPKAMEPAESAARLITDGASTASTPGDVPQ